MDFTALPIGRTMYPMSIFGAIVGLAVGIGYSPANKNHTWYFIAGGAILFFWIGWRIIVWKVKQSQYLEYANETPQVVEKVTLVIHIPELGRKLIHGFSRDELRLIGECVTDGYVYNVQHFKDYFKGTEHDGYSLYNKAVRWMQDVGALAANSKGGWDVTDHIGKHVFESMRDEAWQVLEELDTN